MIELPFTGELAAELELSLRAYAQACAALKLTLRNNPSNYEAARAIKTAVYDQCKEVYERVLARIHVMAVVP